MEFAGGGPGMEGKDPDEVIEQLKTGVKKALENTDQTKLSLIEGIINFEEDGDAEMAGLRVAAFEVDPASYLQSKKKTEKRFAECVRSLQLLRSKLNDAGIEIVFEHETSIYFMGPDGERLELIADPLGEMYGADVS